MRFLLGDGAPPPCGFHFARLLLGDGISSPGGFRERKLTLRAFCLKTACARRAASVSRVFCLDTACARRANFRERKPTLRAPSFWRRRAPAVRLSARGSRRFLLGDGASPPGESLLGDGVCPLGESPREEADASRAFCLDTACARWANLRERKPTLRALSTWRRRVPAVRLSARGSGRFARFLLGYGAPAGRLSFRTFSAWRPHVPAGRLSMRGS